MTWKSRKVGLFAEKAKPSDCIAIEAVLVGSATSVAIIALRPQLTTLFFMLL